MEFCFSSETFCVVLLFGGGGGVKGGSKKKCRLKWNTPSSLALGCMWLQTNNPSIVAAEWCCAHLVSAQFKLFSQNIHFRTEFAEITNQRILISLKKKKNSTRKILKLWFRSNNFALRVAYRYVLSRLWWHWWIDHQCWTEMHVWTLCLQTGHSCCRCCKSYQCLSFFNHCKGRTLVFLKGTVPSLIVDFPQYRLLIAGIIPQSSWSVFGILRKAHVRGSTRDDTKITFKHWIW